jgi:ankyrin repeat protein
VQRSPADRTHAVAIVSPEASGQKETGLARKQTIFDAIESGDPAKVRRKLAREPGAIDERDANGLSPLMRAVYDGRQEIVEVFLEHGPEIDLFEAAALGDEDSIKRVLGRSRERASAYSSDGFTPLHLTAFFGRLEAAALLVDRGANLEAPSRNPRFPSVRPLHSAIAGNQPEVALLLLERGADPNARANGGWTPLHFAATSGDVELCRALLTRGANRAALADDRTRPIDFAIEKRHRDVVELLQGRA